MVRDTALGSLSYRSQSTLMSAAQTVGVPLRGIRGSPERESERERLTRSPPAR
jgi:hypothetical protein